MNPCERALVLNRRPTYNRNVWSCHLTMEVRSWFQVSGEVLNDTRESDMALAKFTSEFAHPHIWVNPDGKSHIWGVA